MELQMLCKMYQLTWKAEDVLTSICCTWVKSWWSLGDWMIGCLLIWMFTTVVQDVVAFFEFVYNCPRGSALKDEDGAMEPESVTFETARWVDDFRGRVGSNCCLWSSHLLLFVCVWWISVPRRRLDPSNIESSSKAFGYHHLWSAGILCLIKNLGRLK